MNSLHLVPRATWRSQRTTYGDLESVLSVAREEHKAGRLHNATAAYHEALSQWLRMKWFEASGKTTSSIVDPRQFLRKLQSGLLLDRWAFAAIQVALSTPDVPTWRSVDVLAGIVNGFCVDRIDSIEVTEVSEVTS